MIKELKYQATFLLVPTIFNIHMFDQLLDELEGRLAPGGKIIDFHSCELFPERWFDAVFVLRTDTKYLFDRLKAR